MERELWPLLSHLLGKLCSSPARGLYGDDDILRCYFWSVLRNHPVSWCCRPEEWSPELRPRVLPSQSTLSKRLRTLGVQQLMSALEQHLLSLTMVASLWVRMIDAKALPVGGSSKDRDAAWGRGSGSIQRGYKFYAVWGAGPLPIAWGLAPLNVSEQRMAQAMIPTLPGEGYLLGDKYYDNNKLFDLAGKAGYQLITPRQKPGTGLGHQRQSPYRLRSIELRKHHFGKALYRCRVHIEHCFAHLTSWVGGLEPLPFWVRRYQRVRNWVHAKLIAYAVKQMRSQLIAIE